ncbi:hypothetical protein PybrP1_010718, partial [[Pythium] brassicae (nom. inval.)]
MILKTLLRQGRVPLISVRIHGWASAVSAPSFAASFSSNSSSSSHGHVPVLLHEAVALWAGDTSRTSSGDRWFVDGTVGFGGHSRALLTRCDDARLLCVDRDAEVLAMAKANLREFGDRVVFQQGSYVDVARHLAAAGFPTGGGVHGVLVDLGANSFHFDQAQRGFSLQHDGPLDMRFDQRGGGATAADVLNTHSEVQLTKIFRDFGEERLAKEFAKAVVRDRDEKQLVFRSTRDLKECIERIARKWQRGTPSKGGARAKAGGTAPQPKPKATMHPATRCFQALRIYVNEELQHVEDGVRALANELAPGGRLVTIAFHSLEDRPIKTLFRKLDNQGRSDDDDNDDDDDSEGLFGLQTEDDSDDEERQLTHAKRFRLTKRKALKPTAEEMARNPRSR